MLDLGDVVQQRGVLRGVLELHHAHPTPVRQCPRSAARWSVLPVAQQVLAQPMLGAQLVLLGRFASPDQVSKSFVSCVRYEYGREVTAAVCARELLGVAPIGLDAIA